MSNIIPSRAYKIFFHVVIVPLEAFKMPVPLRLCVKYLFLDLAQMFLHKEQNDFFLNSNKFVYLLQGSHRIKDATICAFRATININ